MLMLSFVDEKTLSSPAKNKALTVRSVLSSSVSEAFHRATETAEFLPGTDRFCWLDRRRDEPVFFHQNADSMFHILKIHGPDDIAPSASQSITP
jgi:hypothetical protein